MAVSNWTTQQVAIWLKQQGFSNSYADLFCKKHKIDGKALLTLTEHDLKEPPLEITILGDIKRLSLAIRKLQSDNRDDIHQFNFENGDAQKSSNHAGSSRRRVLRMDSESSTISDTDYERDYPGRGDHRSASAAGSSSGRPRLPPEYAKLLLSYLYMFAVFIITAFVMVMANDRVPDTNKYPPLPDLVLDNMPYVPWAFDMCEMCALVLSLILMVTLMFHKHRFIIMRRLFALTGTVFLLRSITMLITSLSVPGVHLDCQPQLFDPAAAIVTPVHFQPGSSLWSKAERAFVIWRGAGMSLQGVRTCGDYMFSGHTVTVTTLNFFITEYTPRRMYWLHTATWVMNMFGIFFILAAHEHYSIDVFIAFYITSRLFLYYHTLANNKALTQGDRKRTRIWFPMFSYFEANVDGMVPNEYEWPISTFFNWVKKNNWFGIIGAIGGRK